MSAANAAVDHIHNLFLGTKEGHHVAMAVWSDGNPYGIEDGIFYSFPVKCKVTYYCWVMMIMMILTK